MVREVCSDLTIQASSKKLTESEVFGNWNGRDVKKRCCGRAGMAATGVVLLVVSLGFLAAAAATRGAYFAAPTILCFTAGVIILVASRTRYVYARTYSDPLIVSSYSRPVHRVENRVPVVAYSPPPVVVSRGVSVGSRSSLPPTQTLAGHVVVGQRPG